MLHCAAGLQVVQANDNATKHSNNPVCHPPALSSQAIHYVRTSTFDKESTAALCSKSYTRPSQDIKQQPIITRQHIDVCVLDQAWIKQVTSAVHFSL
jgi:hypothetical protein